MREAGAEAVVCDLEAAAAEDVTGLVAGADAVVFAAGAGPGSGAAPGPGYWRGSRACGSGRAPAR